MNVRLCPWCGQMTHLVWVHGHAQCDRCKTNIEPCCSGDETCPTAAPTFEELGSPAPAATPVRRA